MNSDADVLIYLEPEIKLLCMCNFAVTHENLMYLKLLLQR